MSGVLTYHVILSAPLTLTAPGGDPNSADTHLFIPGSAVRGALASAYLRKHRTEDAAVDKDFRRLFLSGETRFLNCYPEGQYEGRLLPAPLSFKTTKGDPGLAYDMASCEYADAYRSDDDEPRQLQGLPGRFVRLDHPAVFHHTPPTAVRFHHTRDRKAGHALAGDIFTYVFLQEGERFVGHIVMEGDDEEVMQELLRSPWQIGRACRTGYGGGAQVRLAPETEERNWREVPHPRVMPGEGELVATLLSDYLQEDETGQATLEGFVRTLARSGLKIKDSGVARAFTQFGIQGGYTSVWHLPYPQARSLAAGSVVVLNVAEGPPEELLQHIEWQGIGARRAEGFGRICFNAHGHELEYRHCVPIDSAPDFLGKSHPPESEDKTRAVLGDMRRRLLQQVLDRRLLTKASELLEHTVPSIPSSVLGRLRARVRSAQTSAEIVAWLDQCRNMKAEKALKRVSVKGSALHEWIRDFLAAKAEQDAQVWSTLDAGSACDQEALLDEKSETIALLQDKDLIWTYERKVLDAVLSCLMDRLKEAENAQ